jgi:hypothetical protein
MDDGICKDGTFGCLFKSTFLDLGEPITFMTFAGILLPLT